MPRDAIPSPWAEFLDQIDGRLSAPVDLHCLGGFVVSVCHGLQRPTADLDVLPAASRRNLDELATLGGRGSALARQYRVNIDIAAVATVPESYERRLKSVFPDRFTKLRLFALDPYDLILAKLERNQEIDRDDVRFLATAVPLDVDALRELYVRELRPLLGNPVREDLTLELWAEIIEEARRR